MRARRLVGVLIGVLALGAAAGAQDRGRTKAQGKVLDEQGQPLQDVVVAAVMEGMEKPFQQAKSNNKGEWSISNLAAGKWKFYFGGKEGLEETTVDVAVGESGTVSVPDVKLSKPVDHDAVINAEIQKAAEMLQTRQVSEARKIYENLLAKYPQAQAPFRAQLHGAVGQTYIVENQHAAAVEHLKKATEADPANTDLQLAYGELLTQTGQRAEGEKILLAADLTKAKDPFPFINIAIGRINEQKPEEALDLINRLMAQFPSETSLYYYRGRAYIAAKKLPEARADMEKFVAGAAPTARELPDAKKLLEQLKEAK